MQNRWRIAEKLALRKVTSAGRYMPCLPMVFREGDFVEVTAFVDVISKGRGPNCQRDVRYVIMQITQLKATKDIAVSR